MNDIIVCMKLIAGSINGEHLDELLENSIAKTTNVKAAVAYANSSPKLFDKCWDNSIRITFWCRYDESIPVSTQILKKFLDRRSPNYVCKLVRDIFHAKIIWWEGYGVYIGSANLTSNAWGGNIEAGLFLTEEEIVSKELEEGLNKFFEELDNYSNPLTTEVYNYLKEIETKLRIEIDPKKAEMRKQFEENNPIPSLRPLILMSKRTAVEKKKEAFLKEWNATLQIMRDIADRVSDDVYRPSWITEEVPKGVQTDQFLHAYYYSRVMDGNKARHHEFYEKNQVNPEDALIQAMSWWNKLPKAPHNEDVTIYEWAIYNKVHLGETRILALTSEEFVGVCERIHALREHSKRLEYKSIGLIRPPDGIDADARIRSLGEWLYQQKTKEGKTVLEKLHYLLYGGNSDDIPERLWESYNSDKWDIPHIGISTLGEIIGWAMPDIFPPRNGRTSKALTALGYKVTLHTE